MCVTRLNAFRSAFLWIRRHFAFNVTTLNLDLAFLMAPSRWGAFLFRLVQWFVNNCEHVQACAVILCLKLLHAIHTVGRRKCSFQGCSFFFQIKACGRLKTPTHYSYDISYRIISNTCYIPVSRRCKDYLQDFRMEYKHFRHFIFQHSG